MADKVIYNGSPIFLTGSSTPFQFYNSDAEFVADAPKCANFCARKLGWPVLDVELQDENFFTAFEEAVTTYGNRVYQSLVNQNYLSLQGSDSTVSLNGKVIRPSLTAAIDLSKEYGTEAGIGGNVTKYTGKVPMKLGVQQYDLKQWAIDEGIEGGIEVRKVFFESPPAILRYFDPYAGTGTGIQSLMDAFGFGAMSPGVNFLLMPASFDLAKIQAIEFNDQIRKSHYTFEIVNNNLKIFPVPTTDYDLVIEYYKVAEKLSASSDVTGSVSGSTGDIISNISEVNFDNPEYIKINSIGRDWIFRYAAALCKETLAYIRGKYSSVPVPGAETTLNQADLLTDARTEKAKLLEDLDLILEKTSRAAQLEMKGQETELLSKTLSGVPMQIYVG